MNSKIYIILLIMAVSLVPGISQYTQYTPLYTASTFVKNIDTNLPVGAVPGTPSVSGGSSSYAVPLNVPAGTNGMEPSLGVVYNSFGGNGILGQGWSLSGLSVITRVPKNHYMDGKVSGVNLDLEDAFSLDGQRLILTDGTNGVHGAVYRKETDDFSVITMQGQSGQGPDHIIVETKDGMVYEYGNSSDSRFTAENSNTVLIWRLNRIISKEGNYIEFRYKNADKNSLVDEILYTGNADMFLAPYNKVKFEYTLRLDRSTLYESGQRLSSDYLLSKVVATSGGSNAYKTYEFSYGHDHITSYLNEITEKGSDGTAINSTIFSYGAQPEAFSSDTIGGIYQDNVNWECVAGDLNGDGYSDLVKFSTVKQLHNSAWYVTFTPFYKDPDPENTLYTPGPTYTVPERYALFRHDEKLWDHNQQRIADINGDGSADLMFVKLKNPSGNTYHLEQVRVYHKELNVSGFTFSLSPPLPSYSRIHSSGNYLLAGDFDGDGKTDMLFMLGHNPLSHPDYLKFDNNVWYGGESSLQELTVTGTSHFPSWYWAYCDKVYVLDFDGDGKDDIMLIRQGQAEIFTFDTRTTVRSIYSQQYPTVWHHIYMGDFNGDGKTDLLTRTNPSDNNAPWYLALSTGTGFVESPFFFHRTPAVNQYYYGNQIKISDYNGDGKDDIAHCWNDTNGGSKIDVYYSKGSDVFYRVRHNYSKKIGTVSKEVLNIDSNGDGRAEILDFNANPLKKDILYFRKEGQEHLLQGIKDGHNAGTGFSYRRMTQHEDFYQRYPAGGYPVGAVQVSRYLVERMGRDNGIGGEHTMEYRYRNAMVHKLGKGWLGFQETKATDLTTGFEVTSTLQLDNTYYLFLPKEEKTRYLPSGTLIEESTFYSSIIPMGGKRFWVRADSVLNNKHFETRTVFTTYAYDAYGNRVEEKVDNNGTEIYTTNIGYGQYGSPFPSRPVSVEKRTDRTGEPPYAVGTQYTYNALGQLTGESVFAGSDKSVSTTYARDGYGNVVTQTVTPYGLSPRTETFTYDTRGRFTVSHMNALGQVSTTEYDERWGNPVKTIGVNGFQYRYAYDSFGRLVESVDMQRNLSVEHEYDWTGSGGSGYHIRKKYQPSGGAESVVYYDKLGREVATEVEAFPSGLINTYTNYDSRGNVSSKYGAHKGSESPLIDVYGYDAYNRLVSVTNALGAMQYAYDYQNGYLTVTETNGAGQVSKKVTDAGGKLVTAADDGGTLFYTYYSHGGVRTVSNGTHVLIVNEYDIDGSRTKLTDINAGTTEYITDALGRQVKMKNASGQWHTYSYDILDRVTQHTRPEGSSVYTYYGPGSGSSTNQLEKIVTYGGVEESYTYDAAGRVLTRTDRVDNTDYTTTYAYNNFNDVTDIVYPSGFSLQYSYDVKGYLTHIKAGGGGTAIFTAMDRNGLGQNISYRLGNGRVTTKSYHHGVPTRYYSTGVQDLKFDWNYASMNLMSRMDAVKGRSEEFTYDDLNRLTGTAGTTGVSSLWMMYMNNGNILAKSDVGRYLYNPGKINAVSWISNDFNGFPIHDQDVEYTSFYQPSNIVEGADRADFYYGADDQRIRMEKRKNGVLEYKRYYFGDYEVQVEPGAGITRYIHYISSGNELVAIAEREERAGEGSVSLHYVYTDYLGSILTLTNASGVVEYEQNYDAWGRERDAGTWNYTPTSLTAPRPQWLYRGYTGHEHLYDFGIIHMNGRLYDPFVARVLSPDNYVSVPDNSQHYNRYSYVLNNPLRYTDPSGETPLAVFAMAGLIGGGMNVWSNWDNIVKDPKSIFGYFASGAVGGAVSVVNPLLGASIAMGGNVTTDMIFGNMPDLSSGTDVLKYVGGVLLDGLGAGGSGNLAKAGYQFLVSKGFIQSVSSTGSMRLIDPAKGLAGGIETPEVIVKVTKTAVETGGSHVVYQGLDAAGKIKYVGITGRNAAVRFAEHAAAGGEKGSLFFRTIQGAEGLSKTQARIWEQTLINQHGLQKNGGQLLNRINSIAPENWWQYGIK